MATQYDIAIIGGGIVGMATAMALVKQSTAKVVVLEAEEKLAAHQTGHNSGVIHSGLYYKPGSMKARNCVEGREEMYRFCEEYGIAHDNCGKLVVATSEAEIPALNRLEERGHANGLVGLQRLNSLAELREYEPHVNGIAGLHVKQTGIVDYKAVTDTYGQIVREKGGEIRLNSRVNKVHPGSGEIVLETVTGEVHAHNLINCAGLQSDRVARMCGVDPKLQIVPFRGEYYEIAHEREFLVRNLIYPVPDPAFPFLGVHFTRMIHGGVEAGPNAVLAFKREGYSKWQFNIKDMATYGFYSGFWGMAAKHWKMGMGEFYRSYNKRAFVKALQRLMPELRMEDVHAAGSGIRAQALEPNGQLADDFRIAEAECMVHVLNAPSPAATASISIGRAIAQMAAKNFRL
ncbi:MAG: L-2-hydroxyglutarate oxidase [Chloroflexi bacterium]|nr:MAG: L-2-hydroxyglutarate oxidase [Chloroflexota bacterium]